MHRRKPYYGWFITITLAFTETISWGILYYAFTVFITPMEAELGWSRAELTGGFSLLLLVAGMIAFPIGTWIDKHGARTLMTLGSIGACLLVIAWSQVTSLTGFYLIWAGLGVCGAAILYEPAFAVVAQWFHARRSTALTVITLAAGLASTIFLPLCDALLRAFGWRTAVLILGLFLGCMTIPLHALMLRRHPADLGLLPDGAVKTEADTFTPLPGLPFRAVMNERLFWLVAAGFGLSTLSSAAIRVHLIPYMIDIGIESSTAAAATGVIGIMQVIGRIFFAPIDRRYSIRSIISGIFALQTIALACLLAGHSALAIGAFITLFGASQGAATLSRPSVLIELFGTAQYGRISSVMAIVVTVSNTAAPLMAGLIFDQAGDYQPVLWLVAVLALVATAVAWLSRRANAPVLLTSAP